MVNQESLSVSHLLDRALTRSDGDLLHTMERGGYPFLHKVVNEIDVRNSKEVALAVAVLLSLSVKSNLLYLTPLLHELSTTWLQVHWKSKSKRDHDAVYHTVFERIENLGLQLQSIVRATHSDSGRAVAYFVLRALYSVVVVPYPFKITALSRGNEQQWHDRNCSFCSR